MSRTVFEPYAKCGWPSDYARAPGMRRVRTWAIREKDRRIPRTTEWPRKEVASLDFGALLFIW